VFFLLIFPVLVAGFVACHIHPVYRYSLHRFEGQYLYLKSAELGLKCFGIALLLGVGGHYALPNSLVLCNASINLSLAPALAETMGVLGASPGGEADKMAWFMILSFLSFVSAFIIRAYTCIGLFFRFGQWKTKIYVIGQLLEDSPLDFLLYSLSLDASKQVMLTMSDRKVYVGRVISLGEPSATSGMDQDVSIVPIMSGYRDKDTLTVTFTTHYNDAPNDIYLSLRQSAILAATEFNFDAYKIWQNNGTETEAAQKSTDIMSNGRDSQHLSDERV
jgi:hypothetical protein